MTLRTRTTTVVVLLAGLWLAPSSLAADLDTLLRDFRATPIGLKPAPAFTLKTLDGKTATLADQRGRPVLLYFWATW
jgi:cytochrome c biogenesis protein CcmG/thiol:disulfide interchange protein DsbE